jgi:hypothetical protein
MRHNKNILFRIKAPQAALAFALYLILASLPLPHSPAYALIRMEIDTIMVRGVKMVVRASSCLGGPRIFSLANLFDNDSTTPWIEGNADSLSGRWFDITFQDKKRFRGIIFGMGRRSDFINLADFGIPAGLRINLDEKKPIDRNIAWEWGNEGLLSTDVNMRKTIVWFDSDTAFTTAQFRVKITSVISGRRYLNMAISDFEPVDAYDNRFELLKVVTGRSFNPNDLGVVYSPVFPEAPGELEWILHVADSIVASVPRADAGRLALALNSGLNQGAQPITDNAGILKYVAALKAMLVTGAAAPRFVFNGRKASYLIPVDSLRHGKLRIDIWRVISSQRTAKGLEVTVGYQAFVN